MKFVWCYLWNSWLNKRGVEGGVCGTILYPVFILITHFYCDLTLFTLSHTRRRRVNACMFFLVLLGNLWIVGVNKRTPCCVQWMRKTFRVFTTCTKPAWGLWTWSLSWLCQGIFLWLLISLAFSFISISHKAECSCIEYQNMQAKEDMAKRNCIISFVDRSTSAAQDGGWAVRVLGLGRQAHSTASRLAQEKKGKQWCCLSATSVMQAVLS